MSIKIIILEEVVLKWLLVKKVTKWAYRTIAELSSISAPPLVRREAQFHRHHVYEALFSELVRRAVKIGLIKGKRDAMDGSFVATYSKKKEPGSLRWNGFKKAYGFKLHALVDVEMRFPIALVITDGLFPECQIAIPLMKRAKRFRKKHHTLFATFCISQKHR